MSATPVDPLEAASTRKGCLAIYGVWTAFTPPRRRDSASAYDKSRLR